ncbi:MAG: hypothetical protein JXB88_04980 [Spirochaetales bacterium]|nr:hypothetical protein [Spirochaetales bacterium]
MTGKRTLFVLLILGLTISLFGYGQWDGSGTGNQEFKNFIESREKITLTGRIIISNRVFPELNAGDDTYKLMVPRYCLADTDITDNMEVTVEGVKLKVKQGVQTRFLNEGDEVLFVTKAVINGKEYNPEQGFKQCQEPNQGKWGRMNHHYKGNRGTGPGFKGSFFDMFE